MKFWPVVFVSLLFDSKILVYAIEGGNGTKDDLARISGGAAVTNPPISTYPWMVAIVRNINPPGALTYYGNGVAVSQHWVLTSGLIANYARVNSDVHEIWARFGSVDISATCNTCLNRRIVNGKQHTSYVGTTLVGNIGLVKVCPYFPTTMTYAPLPSSTPTISNPMTGTSLGWQSGQTALRALVQTVELDATCSGGLSAAVFAGNPWETQNFCMVLVTGRGTCTNDRGGPFVMSNVVVAVLDVSGCTTANTDTYTKLDTTYINWINTNKVL